jgi:hypothetical protein
MPPNYSRKGAILLFCRSEIFSEEMADNGAFLIVPEPCQHPPYNFEDIFNEGNI